jgi:hypothetical protein
MPRTTAQTKAQSNGHRSSTTDIILTAAPTAVERDVFDSEEFEGSRDSFPYLQMLNHQSLEQSGFFITLENAEAVHFNPTEEWTPYTETFQSGESSDGYRSLLARFLILRKSNLLMFDREQGEFIGEYKKSQYDKNTMVLKRRFLVYLISKDKHLLHDTPLLLTAKGAFCGSFGETVGRFHADMSKAYTQATGAKKLRGDRFMALSILAVKVKPELKGTTKKSWTCSVDTYGVPTAENWKSFFVGYKPELKERILKEFEGWVEFGSPQREMPSATDSKPTEQVSENRVDDASDDDYEDIDFGYPEEI